MITAVDSCVLIDVLEDDPEYGASSAEALRRCLLEGAVVACEVAWAEVATAYGERVEEVAEALAAANIGYSPMSREAALVAAQRWQAHRKTGRKSGRIVADFLLGAHALVQSDRLLTRDKGFFRSCFRPLKLVSPE
jgi:predicted nucleic acid-binding protein